MLPALLMSAGLLLRDVRDCKQRKPAFGFAHVTYTSDLPTLLESACLLASQALYQASYMPRGLCSLNHIFVYSHCQLLSVCHSRKNTKHKNWQSRTTPSFSCHCRHSGNSSDSGSIGDIVLWCFRCQCSNSRAGGNISSISCLGGYRRQSPH